MERENGGSEDGDASGAAPWGGGGDGEELQRERVKRSDRHRRKKDDGTEPEVDPERDQRTVFAFQLSLKADERASMSSSQEQEVNLNCSVLKLRNETLLILVYLLGLSTLYKYIEFYDVMSVPMAIALTGQPLLGQAVMVKPSEAEKNLAQSNATSGGAASGGARKLYVGNLHSNITEDQLRQNSSPNPLSELCFKLLIKHFYGLKMQKAAQSLNGQLDIAGRVIKSPSDAEIGSGTATSLTGGIGAPGLNSSVGLPAASVLGALTAASLLVQPVGAVPGHLFLSSLNLLILTDPDFDLDIRDDVKEECSNLV
ncbi:hypothetical protein ZWY2020_006044 [Hordeum vulgare]|nr:hypothetical protein ZWY2020_006044 [Hordeum vulgare]